MRWGATKILGKLLIAAVADAEFIVRHSIFSSLNGNGGFDDFLEQDDSSTTLFAALNDEEYICGCANSRWRWVLSLVSALYLLDRQSCHNPAISACSGSFKEP
ncbi:serine/threonine-protein kinase TOR-like isoform X2 [Apium graveolens]|uniref:serine/threonine-protein kinase TOR-like isoform X2 n=1 Tax=Apium graveolens TaxID=4045 RepID=UPI003D79F299